MYSESPPNQAQNSIEKTFSGISEDPESFIFNSRVEQNKVPTHKVLQFTRPHAIIFVEWVLGCNGDETSDFLFLRENILGGLIEDRLHYSIPLLAETLEEPRTHGIKKECMRSTKPRTA